MEKLRIAVISTTVVVIGVVLAVLYVGHASAGDWATALIAVVALVLGIFNAWQSHLSPFSLVVRDTGRLEWSMDPRNISEPAVFLDLVFTNAGACRGFVEQLAFRAALEEVSHRVTTFVPIYTALDRSLNLGKELPPPTWEPFTGFTLGPKESLVRKIGFVPFKVPSGFEYKEGVYALKLFVLTSGRKGWRMIETLRYPFEKTDLEQLQKIMATPQRDGRRQVQWFTQSKYSDGLLKTLSELDNLNT